MKCQMRGQDWLKMLSGMPFLFVQNVIFLCLAGELRGGGVCFLPLVMRIYKHPLRERQREALLCLRPQALMI